MRKVFMTFDVEDWFQGIFDRDRYPVSTWSKRRLMLTEPLEFILEELDCFKVRGTFFVVGWFAENYPEIVAKIHERGHEIASHGMTHIPNNLLSDEALEYEVSRSKECLERIISEEVWGYRAASYSISEQLLDKLLKCGYRYDSSYFPVKGNRAYGRICPSLLNNYESKGLKEFPIQAGKVFGVKVPFAGGTYFRLLPLRIMKHLIQTLDEDQLVMYFHPYDFDKRERTLKEYSLIQKVKSIVGRKGDRSKFIKLLEWFSHNGYQFESLRSQL